MALELFKESVKINRVIGDIKTQAMIEHDIIVPDAKPDITRILLLDGDAYIDNTDIVQDKIIINGTMRYKILYISEDSLQKVKSITTTAAFSHGLEMKNLNEGMNCKVKCDIEHMDYNLLNSRKIGIKTILNMDGKVMEESEQLIVSDLSGVDDIQFLRSNVKVNSYLGYKEDVATISETVDIPAGKPTIREILRNDVKISGKDYKITDNKVMIKGELNVSTLYTADDETGSIQFMEHEFPFMHFIDLPGVDENAICNVDCKIKDSVFETAEDSDGELRVLKCEISLDIWAEGTSNYEMSTVEDVYSPKSRLDIDRSAFLIEEFVAENRSEVILKDIIVIGDEKPDISQVFNVIARPILSDFRILEDKIVVEGVAAIKILYLANSDEQPVYCYEEELPIRHSMDVKAINPQMGADVEMEIESLSFNMASTREVEVRIALNVVAKFYRNKEIYLIDKVEESPLDSRWVSEQPSITIYFVKPGDTLWDIAKKYYTTIDDIVKVNRLNDSRVNGKGAVNPGQKIIVPRRMRVTAK